MSVIGDALKQAERSIPREGADRRGGVSPASASATNLDDQLTRTKVHPRPHSRAWALPGGVGDWLAVVMATAVLAMMVVVFVGQRPVGAADSAQPGGFLASAALRPAAESLRLDDGAAGDRTEPRALQFVTGRKNAGDGVNDGTGSVASLRSGYVLEGMLYGDDNPVAVINGVMLGVGEQVGDAEVVRIGRTQVRLRVEGVEFEVSLRSAPRR